MKSFEETLEFNQFVIKQFTKRKAYNLLVVNETEFKDSLQDFLKNLHQYKRLIESHAALAEMEQSKASREESRRLQHGQLEILQQQLDMSYEAQNSQNEQLNMLKSQLQMTYEAEEKRQVATIIEMISPASVDVDQWSSARVCRQFPQFGEWLLYHPMMHNWFDLANQNGCFLHLKALPGAGKTILASKLVAVRQTKPTRNTFSSISSRKIHHETLWSPF